MSIIGSLSSLVRGKVGRSSSGRRHAAPSRTLQVETLESRLPLSVVPPTVAVDLVEDTSKPVGDAAETVLVADAQAGGKAADGRSAEQKPRLVDAMNAAGRSDTSGISVGDSTIVSVLLAEAKAVLSGRAAADGLLACRPVELTVADGGTVGVDADSNLLADLRRPSSPAFPEGRRIEKAWMRGLVPIDFIGPRLARRALAEYRLQDGLQTHLRPTVPTQNANSESTSSESEGGDTSGVSTSPVIVSFGVTAGVNGLWFIDGEVNYRDPSILVVYFGGLPDWHSVNPEPDGTFSYALELPLGFSTVISAQAFSPMEEASNVAFAWI